VADVDKALAGELEVLAHSKLSQMPGQIEVLAAIDDSRVPVVLQALLDGRLYTRKSDRKMFIGNPGAERSLELVDPLGETESSTAPAREFKRIRVNNRMRSQLRFTISKINLKSVDVKQRLAAVLRLLDDLSPEVLGLLDEVAKTEADKDILEAVAVAQGLIALDGDDRLEKLAAIDLLSGSLQAVVVNRLRLVVARDANGDPVETDPVIYKRAEMAVAAIEGKESFYQFLKTCPSCKYNRAVFLAIHCYRHQAAILPYRWCRPPTWGNATIFPISGGSTGRVSGGSLFSDKCVLHVW
jgi:urea transport system permease protein